MFCMSRVRTVRTIRFDQQAIQVLYMFCMLRICNTLLTHGVLKMVSNVCREVDEVREERLR